MPRNILTGKRAVVTGASSGLGEQCAILFAKLGASVTIVARRRTRLVRVRKVIRADKGDALLIQADLSKSDEILKVCSIVDKELGGCDILINNAGVYFGDVSVVETDLQDWKQLIDTNLRAPYFLCRTLVPGMIKQGYGRIINIISGTNHLEGVGLFRISKIGLEVATAVLGEELKGTGVTATAFNPGWMKTESCCYGRSPKGAAHALTRLVQRRESFLNGGIIDLKWSKRSYRFCKRPTNRGRFGLGP